MAGGLHHILFDFSKFADQFYQDGPSGIARVNIEFARWLSHEPAIHVTGLHARYGIVTRFGRRKLADMALGIEREWARGEDHALGEALRAWLANPTSERRRIRLETPASAHHRRKVTQIVARWPWHTALAPQARGSIYLNVSYGNLQNPHALDWLDRRPDIRPVFMVHDLLPLDHPDLFWPALKHQFPVQIAHVIRRARLVIVPSDPVRQRLAAEAARHGRAGLEIAVLPLPPAPAFLTREPVTPPESARPYFVMCSTIEPRKGHAFLLALWRDMARKLGAACPRLVIVGARGWNNDAVFEVLDTAEDLATHILEVNSLPSEDLVTLLSGACGLLMPSEGEGYGMPVVESLTLGVPVLACDIPVFHAVTQGCARLLPKRDAAAWEDAILTLVRDPDSLSEARQAAAGFRAPRWEGYFAEIESLLRALPP